MNLRIRTLILVAISILLLTGVLYAASILLINNRVQAVEKQIADQEITQASAAIQKEMDRLTSVAGDWGTWDDTYQFIQDQNSAYASTNLTTSSIAVLDINQIVFIDTNGVIKFSKGIDLVSKLEVPLPQDISLAISGNPDVWNFSRGVVSHSGLFNIAGGKLFFASQPIVKSNGTGPVMGAVAIFRYIDSTELARLTGNTQLILNLTAAPANLPAALLKNRPASSVINISTAYSANAIRSLTAVIDFTTTNPIFMQIESPRTVYQTMSAVNYTILTVFITFAAMFIVITWFFIQRATVQPVEAINQSVIKIDKENDLSQRILVRTRNEIGRLAGSINTLLEDHEKSQILVQNRLNQIRTVAEISRTVTSVLDPQALAMQVAEMVKDRFNLYYVGVFLLDEKSEYALLRAGTGQAGKTMMDAGHRLAVGGSSMIGWCTQNRKARIALDVGREAVRFENPNLPLTRSELAIPIVSRISVFGALTLQSDQVNAFNEEDIQIFQGIADSMAIALENARLFQESQKSIDEIQKLNRAYIQTSWQERLLSEQDLSFKYENPSLKAESPAKQMNFPIRLRDQNLGNLVLETSDQAFQPADVELINAITDQIALALENVRLLEGTQSRAAYERRLNEMTADFSQKTNVEDILRSISRELSTIPFVNSVSINIKPTVSTDVSEDLSEKKGDSNDDQINF